MGKSAIAHGGVIFWFDASSKNLNTIAKPIFDRYGLKFTESVKCKYINGDGIQTISDLHDLQNAGNDMVAYPWNSTALTTLTATGVDTEVTKVRDFMVANNLRGSTIMAFSQGAHNRLVDSIISLRGYEYGRGGSIFSKGQLNYSTLPLNSTRLVMGQQTYYSQSSDSLKKLIDTAATYSLLSTFLFHGVDSIQNISTTIDTGKLNDILKYCHDKIVAGTLGGAGRFTDYLLYAPDSCIIYKSTSSISTSYTTNDSLEKFVDSCKVFIYDSVAGGSRTLIDSTAILHGGDTFSFTVSTDTPKSTYYWLTVRNASGAIDSSFGRRKVGSDNKIINFIGKFKHVFGF
jgi:hypothetical protein